ncbi:MAG: hypothetical protein M1827_004857 [Pycnora praestabilis]|nr:MAG: hypothetical protein M1827_004857 [Pycnora praestabilis]
MTALPGAALATSGPSLPAPLPSTLFTRDTAQSFHLHCSTLPSLLPPYGLGLFLPQHPPALYAGIYTSPLALCAPSTQIPSLNCRCMYEKQWGFVTLVCGGYKSFFTEGARALCLTHCTCVLLNDQSDGDGGLGQGGDGVGQGDGDGESTSGARIDVGTQYEGGDGDGESAGCQGSTTDDHLPSGTGGRTGDQQCVNEVGDVAVDMIGCGGYNDLCVKSGSCCAGFSCIERQLKLDPSVLFGPAKNMLGKVGFCLGDGVSS